MNRVIVFSMGLFLFASPAFAQADFSCTKAKIETLRKKATTSKANGKFHYAFAAGKAKTITGMQGCGVSGLQRTEAAARNVALMFCRKYAANPQTCSVSILYRTDGSK